MEYPEWKSGSEQISMNTNRLLVRSQAAVHDDVRANTNIVCTSHDLHTEHGDDGRGGDRDDVAHDAWHAWRWYVCDGGVWCAVERVWWHVYAIHQLPATTTKLPPAIVMPISI